MPTQKKAKPQHTGHKGVYLLADGRYQIRFTAVSPKTGKVVYRKTILPEGTTFGQAIDELMRRQEELRQGAQTAPLGRPPKRRMTLRDYAPQWLARRSSANSYTDHTHTTNSTRLAHHILPFLGDHYLDALTRADIEAWVAWTATRRRRVPANRKFANPQERVAAQQEAPFCSHATRRSWWRVLSVMLKDAYADGHLEQDVTYRVGGPRAQPKDQARRELRTLTSEQLAALLTELQGHAPHRYAEAVVLGVTGMRSGELWALHWDALELEDTGGRIIIEASVQDNEQRGQTKTKARRIVPIPGWVCQVLQVHRRQQVAQQVPGLSKGIVFPSMTGGYRTSGSLSKTLGSACKLAGIKQRVTPQVLRRSFNTLMINAGVDRIVLRAMMGHSSEEMTEHYAGVGFQDKARAQESIVVDLGVRVRKEAP